MLLCFVIGWKNLAPLSKPIKSNTKPNSWPALLCFSRACRPLLVSSQDQIDSFEFQRVLWLARMTNFMTLILRLLCTKKTVSCVRKWDLLQHMRNECLWGIPLLATLSVIELVKNAVTLLNSPLPSKNFKVKCPGLNERDTICFFFAVVIDSTTFSLTDFRLHSVSLDYGRLLN